MTLGRKATPAGVAFQLHGERGSRAHDGEALSAQLAERETTRRGRTEFTDWSDGAG